MTKLLGIFWASVFLMGCSGSGGGSGGGGGPGGDVIQGLGYNPSQRWPEMGDITYDYTSSVNGVSCSTQKSFSSRATYCMALQDYKLNDGCALSMRKSAYSQDCGDDFQEINFPSSFWISGYDPRLQKSCSTGEHTSSYFSYTSEFCSFLKNEELHKNCFWDRRLQKSQELRCQGGFSPEPQSPPTTTTLVMPNPPTTTLQPLPPSDPLDQIPVVQVLRSNGIEVEVNWLAIRKAHNQFDPVGGYPKKPLEEEMDLFWSQVNSNVNAIISRKAQINKLEVSIFSDYLAKSKTLGLQYKLKPNSLKDYFPSFDRLTTLANKLEMSFNFSHGYYADEQMFADLTRTLPILERNYTNLFLTKGAVKSIKVSNSTYWFGIDRELQLKSSDEESSLVRMLDLLKPLAPIYLWADRNAIKIEGRFDIPADAAKIQATFKTLEKNQKALELMKNAQMLKEISISKASSDTRYYSSLGLISVVTDSQKQSELNEILQTFGKLAQSSLDLKVKVTLDTSSALGSDFFKMAKLYESVLPQIKTKASRLKEIQLGLGKTNYYAGLKLLVIGPDSTQQEVLKVINSIQ